MKKWYWIIILIASIIIFLAFEFYYYPSFVQENKVVEGYDMFKDLLTIILAFAGLIIALLGAAMYAWVSKALDDRVEKKVNEQINSATARLYLNLSYIHWQSYEKKNGELKKNKKDELKIALEQSENALKRVKNLDKKRFEALICTTKNNLAYHLCRRGCQDDARRAIPLAKYAYDRVWNYDYETLSCKWVETYVFVLTKMGDKKQKKEGIKIINETLEREELPNSLRVYMKKKYKKYLRVR